MIYGLLMLAALQPADIAPDLLAAPHPRRPLAALIFPPDYPQALVGSGAQGRTVVRLGVAATGRVVRCEVLRSSGTAVLDATTCRLLAHRAAFVPGRDAAGNPVPGDYSGAIDWRDPAAPAPRR
jgi:protein TonB